MAVKPEIIKARLKALFPKANLSQKRLDAIADKLAKKPADDADDAAIDVVINDFNDVISIEEIAKDDDRARTLEADNKAKTELLAKNVGKKEDEEEEDPSKKKNDDDAPAWAKALLEKVDNLEKGKVTETKIQTATKLFGSSEILKGMKPELQEQWIKRVDTNSETPIEDQVKALETEYTEIRQSVADQTQYSGGVPYRTKGGDEPSAEDIKLIVDELV
ncbi:MAG: hypothetical protein KGZ87_05350 [Bacteroidetes bacterium]|nr:hypothetical protein [Bacteroidota bacterium]